MQALKYRDVYIACRIQHYHCAVMQGRSLAVFLLALLWVADSSARMLPLSDNSERFPYLFDEATARYVEWDSSGITQSIAMSSAVRFTGRGLYFLHRSERVIDELVHGPDWICEPCTMAMDAFCSLDNGDGSLFPQVGSAVKVQDAVPHVAANSLVFEDDGVAQKCVSGSGRSIQYGAAGYDLSLCDLVDVGVYAVYRNGEVCLSHRAPMPVLYIISAFLIVLLSIFATQNILADLHLQSSTNERGMRVWFRQVGVLALWIALLVLTCVARGPPPVTVEDETLNVVNLVYVALYSVHWIFEFVVLLEQGGSQSCFPVNAILATVLFALSNFYGSYANNYIEVFLFLLLMRFMQKCMRPRALLPADGSNHYAIVLGLIREVSCQIIMVVDVFFLSLLACTAFRFHLADDTYCDMYLTVLLITTIALASVLQRVSSE